MRVVVGQVLGLLCCRAGVFLLEWAEGKGNAEQSRRERDAFAEEMERFERTSKRIWDLSVN